MIVLYTLLELALVLVIGGFLLLWWLSRRREQPCPAYLGWMVDSPLADIISGTYKTLDRIGLEPGQRVLDVGCGPGRLSRPAARRVGPTGTVVAYDVQPGMLASLEKQAARLGLTNIVTQLGDISSDQSLPSDSFDRAWLVAVIGEVSDRAAALRNLYRVIKPGGILSITETMRDPHYQRRQTVLQLCEQAGFVATQYWGSLWEYTQNFSKPPRDMG